MGKFFLSVSKSLTAALATMGQVLMHMQSLLRILVSGGTSVDQVSEQVWSVMKQSALITSVSGLFVGAIMSVQFAMQVNQFGALGYLGGLATSATVREIGPLLIAFLLAGRVGAYTSAELGSMKVTEQIDAVRCLGIDPLQVLVLPRFLGIVVASFFLLGVGLLTSIFGGIIMGRLVAGVGWEEYVRHIPSIVHPFSIAVGLTKAFVFSFALASICTFFGIRAEGGARGVSAAVVQTSVITMVVIVVSDWVLSTLFTGIQELLMGASL